MHARSQRGCMKNRLTNRPYSYFIRVWIHCVYGVYQSTKLFIMAALRSRCGHYIFALWFLLSSFVFTRLIWAVAEWMSTILLYMVWP